MNNVNQTRGTRYPSLREKNRYIYIYNRNIKSNMLLSFASLRLFIVVLFNSYDDDGDDDCWFGSCYSACGELPRKTSPVASIEPPLPTLC